MDALLDARQHALAVGKVDIFARADGPWDAERSTVAFMAALPAYRAHGLLAVCINLSGGSPQGYSWNQP